MLEPGLGCNLRRKKINAVYASPTREDLGRPCQEFDDKLAALARELRAEIPGIAFDVNASAESYRIILPRKRSMETSNKLISIFSESPLSITGDAHFGALF